MTTDYDALILSRPIRNQGEPTQVDVWCARAVTTITDLRAEVERLKANRYTEAWREATARAERAEADRDALLGLLRNIQKWLRAGSDPKVYVGSRLGYAIDAALAKGKP